jgi:hypothetical protein
VVGLLGDSKVETSTQVSHNGWLLSRGGRSLPSKCQQF